MKMKDVQGSSGNFSKESTRAKLLQTAKYMDTSLGHISSKLYDPSAASQGAPMASTDKIQKTGTQSCRFDVVKDSAGRSKAFREIIRAVTKHESSIQKKTVSSAVDNYGSLKAPLKNYTRSQTVRKQRTADLISRCGHLPTIYSFAM